MTPEEDKEKKALSGVRMEHARECLRTARVNYRHKDYRASANRSYYAIFHAMRAVLAFDGIDRQKHSAVIAEFRRLYVKTGIFSEDISDIIGNAFDLRTEADYDDFYVADAENVWKQIVNAAKLITEIEQYLKSKQC